MFEEGFRIIIGIDLPNKRSMMHLDTIFTIIDTDKAIVFDHDIGTNFHQDSMGLINWC